MHCKVHEIEESLESIMPAKSLGTPAMIYATDELQHPLPHYTILSEADMNNAIGRSDTRAHSYASPLSTQHCLKGEGFNSRITRLKGKGVGNS